MFFCEICKIFKNIFSYRTPPVAASVPMQLHCYCLRIHEAIRYCKVHYFADDTNLIHTNKSVKNLNKLVNHDMKQLNNWLSANKISHNVEKTNYW